MSAAHRSLVELLGATPPASVRELPPDSQQRLATLLARAREEQARWLREGLDASLQHLPSPLRGLARKILLP